MFSIRSKKQKTTKTCPVFPTDPHRDDVQLASMVYIVKIYVGETGIKTVTGQVWGNRPPSSVK